MISVRRNQNEFGYRQQLEIAIEESLNANNCRLLVPLVANAGTDNVRGAVAMGVDSKETFS